MPIKPMEQPGQFNIDPIAVKYAQREPLTPEEETLLREWIARGEGRAQLLEQLRGGPDWADTDPTPDDKHADIRIWNKLETRLQGEGFWPDNDIAAPIPVIPARHTIPWRTAIAVAASILIVATGVLLWTTRRNTTTPTTPVAGIVSADVQPGGNRAMLTLADGSHIDLDSTANGVLSSQGNTFVAKQDGLLAYNKASSEKPAGLTYNTLTTPRAGQFKLTLSDGTRVWLNNASALRYPVWFTGNTREVDLDGEAYFEVAKDAAHPFRVHIHNGVAGQDGGTIDVLGTSFNIMAYDDESAERATLIDGSIRYSRAGATALLKPEEQSVLDAQGHLKTLHNVNVAEITAWKNGYFHFDHANLETTMRQLARWYDVTVEYQGNIPPQEFHGRIQRSMSLSAVLKGLEGDDIHFRLEGKRLTVMP
ncbi:MAG TPA: FecR domain-containing protein [Puia sp.]|nr:FecR domain-containing protein [Puia sp.]